MADEIKLGDLVQIIDRPKKPHMSGYYPTIGTVGVVIAIKHMMRGGKPRTYIRIDDGGVGMLERFFQKVPPKSVEFWAGQQTGKELDCLQTLGEEK